jgi:RNA polymerase sigma-70 factor (ECF subfamily)
MDPALQHDASKTSADTALVPRLRAGEPQAFQEIFDRYYPELVAHAHRYVRRAAIAEELTQEAYCRMWERRARLPEQFQPRAYLYAIVRHAAMATVRREVLERRAIVVTPDTSERYAVPDILVALDQSDAHAALRAAILLLPPRLRTVVELRWERQLKVAEVASILGISPKAVETSITRAIKTLRARLTATQ